MPRWSIFVIVLPIFLATSSACGGCSEDASRPGSTQGGDVSLDGASDATADEERGTNGDATDASSSDADVDDDCPPYHERCDGECVPTTTDPDNCGGCGVTCVDGEACSGGECVLEGDCTSGHRACNRRCVDTGWDDDNCGACGEACPDDQGCVEGDCVPTVDLDGGPDQCDAGGPAIDLGETVDDERRCTGDLAERTFRWGVCSCEGVETNNELFVDAYNSGAGPYTPGGEGGGVGANDGMVSNNAIDITGTLWVAGEDGVSLNDPGSIGRRLLVDGPVSFGSETTVGSHAYIGGPLDISESLDIGGTLHIPPGTDPDSSVSYGNLQRQPIDVPEPCTECAVDDRIPVGDIVAAHRDDNENDLVGLESDVLERPQDPLRLDLPCGRYYLEQIDTESDLTIVAHGQTALFIDGDIDAENELTIALTESASLDVFVTGDVVVGNGLVLGSPNYPALMRTYIGGDRGLVVNNPSRVGSFVYAVPGGLDNNNETEVFGGVYVQRFRTNNESSIHYDRRGLTVGSDCPEPGDGPDPGADAGHDAGSDAGDGGGSTCNTEGGGCTDESDCCSPLECIEGQCQLLGCAPLNSECSDNDECCSGSCGGGVCVDG